jgi:Ca-activated chloride channel family protein
MTLRHSYSNRQARFSASLLLVLSFLSLLSVTSVAQAPDSQAEDVIRIRTDLIAVPFAVTDSRGRQISGLSEHDFALTDDGHGTQIQYFASGTEQVALVFLLDNSGSLREQLSRQRHAALALFERFGLQSSVGVIRFGQEARFVAAFTRETDKARAAFDVSVGLSERTAIFDAAMAAVKAYETRRENSTERRIVILISDGIDTASNANARQAVDAANRGNVSFYVIQLPLFTPREGRLVPRPAARGFRELAVNTGGKFFVAGTAQSSLGLKDPVDLTSVFAAIEQDLRSQYVVGFYPSAGSRDGRSHPVVVTLSNPNNKLRVRQLKTSYQLNP